MRPLAQKVLQIKKENVGPVYHDHISDKIILEILAEKFADELQDLLSSLVTKKTRLSLSIEDYDQIKDLLWKVVFSENKSQTQTSLYRFKIVRKSLFKIHFRIESLFL